MSRHVAFIGGGNMASAILGGLIQQGHPADHFDVVEPYAETRQALIQRWGVRVHATAGPELQQAETVIWAVKPQTLHEAAQAVAPFTRDALHLSVAAGIPSDSIARWLGTERVVRSMPNTPALIGMGITGLYARAGVDEADRKTVETIIATTGRHMWLAQEDLLNAVTALSGSGPAYVFYFLEIMRNAGTAMGLSPEQAYTLAVETFRGASALAAASKETPEVLRQRVTSKGGTTHAAITTLDAHQVPRAFDTALQAAERRARELGEEFGRDA